MCRVVWGAEGGSRAEFASGKLGGTGEGARKSGGGGGETSFVQIVWLRELRN